MNKPIACSQKQLDQYQILQRVYQKYSIPVGKVIWDNDCYKLPDYSNPNFDLFPKDSKRFNHVLLKKELGLQQKSLYHYLRHKEDDYLDSFLDKYYNIDPGRKYFLTYGHLIACSLVPYAEGAAAYFDKSLPKDIKKLRQLANVVPETAWCNESNDKDSRGQNYFEMITHAFIQEHDDFDSIEYKVTPIYIHANPDHQLPIMICMQAKIHPKKGKKTQFPDLDSHSFSVLIPNTQVDIPALDYGFAKLKFKKK